MKRKLQLERDYEHPPALVWEALTDPAALGEWLMPVFDFAAQAGNEFTFRTRPQPGWDGVVRCKVLEVVPERLLRFTWQGGNLDTEVTFRLTPTPTGTRLVLEHTGFEGLRGVIISTFLRGGWRKMLRKRLPRVLVRLAGKLGDPLVAAACQPSLYERVLGFLTKRLPN